MTEVLLTLRSSPLRWSLAEVLPTLRRSVPAPAEVLLTLRSARLTEVLLTLRSGGAAEVLPTLRCCAPAEVLPTLRSDVPTEVLLTLRSAVHAEVLLTLRLWISPALSPEAGAARILTSCSAACPAGPLRGADPQQAGAAPAGTTGLQLVLAPVAIPIRTHPQRHPKPWSSQRPPARSAA